MWTEYGFLPSFDFIIIQLLTSVLELSFLSQTQSSSAVMQKPLPLLLLFPDALLHIKASCIAS